MTVTVRRFRAPFGGDLIKCTESMLPMVATPAAIEALRADSLYSKGDGDALQNVAHPVAITDAMLDAGYEAREANLRAGGSSVDMLKAVYVAMINAAPPVPEDLSDESLETVVIAIHRPNGIVDLEIIEPTEEDVKNAVAGATLCWFEEIIYGHDDDGKHYLRVLPTDDFRTGPPEMLAWFDKKAKGDDGHD